MDWWVWPILVIALLVAVLGFFEWRSWRKPLPSGLDGQRHIPGSSETGPNSVGFG